MKNKKYIIGMATIKSSLNPTYLEFVHDSIEIIRKMFFFYCKIQFPFSNIFFIIISFSIIWMHKADFSMQEFIFLLIDHHSAGKS